MIKTPKKYVNVLFDLDGVLIDNSEGIIATVRYAIDKVGVAQPPDETVRKFIGPHMGFSFIHYAGMTPEQMQEAVKIYRSKYLFMGIDMYKVYDGAAETLGRLSAAGIICNVCSNKPTDVVKYIMRTAGLEKYIHACHGSTFPVRPDADIEIIEGAITARPVLIVGDRSFDADSARSLDADSALVTYGFGEPDKVERSKPTYAIDNLKELIEIVL